MQGDMRKGSSYSEATQVRSLSPQCVIKLHVPPSARISGRRLTRMGNGHYKTAGAGRCSRRRKKTQSNSRDVFFSDDRKVAKAVIGTGSVEKPECGYRHET